MDHHQYSANWGIDNAALTNTVKGGLITEGGSRWYQNNMIGKQVDQGSPKVVLNWLEGLRAGVPRKPAYLPGMVGSDNNDNNDK